MLQRSLCQQCRHVRKVTVCHTACRQVNETVCGRLAQPEIYRIAGCTIKGGALDTRTTSVPGVQYQVVMVKHNHPVGLVGLFALFLK